MMSSARNTHTWLERTKRIALGIRYRVLRHTLEAGGGYLSQACSSAEILAALYTKVMHLGKVSSPIMPARFCGVPSLRNSDYVTGARFNGPKKPQYDRFVLSPAHYSLALYAVLVETGRMDEKGLLDFNKNGSSVEMIGAEHSPGMEVMTGSLGQGVSQAVGIALARKKRKESGKVWVFMSDGEFQIGQTWEALEFASYHSLSNLGIYVDVNRYQCDGSVDSVMDISPLDKRLTSFGAEVVLCPGHDIEALSDAAEKRKKKAPLIVLAETTPWQGIDMLRQREPKFHYVRLYTDEEKAAYRKVLHRYKEKIDRGID
jgi:transketolase